MVSLSELCVSLEPKLAGVAGVSGQLLWFPASQVTRQEGGLVVFH